MELDGSSVVLGWCCDVSRILFYKRSSFIKDPLHVFSWANYCDCLTTAVAWNFEPFVLAQCYSYRVETQTERCALINSILL